MPAAHGFRRPFRLRKPHATQRLDRFGIIRRACKDKTSLTRREIGPLLEETRIMLLDKAGFVRQRLGKRCQPGIAAKLRKLGQMFLVRGKPLGLLVRHHLQPVLDGAQKDIGPRQIAQRIARNPAIRNQCLQHFERATPPQPRASAAKHQLLRLHEELDLANTAPPQFDIMARYRNRIMAAHRMDLPLHRVNIGNRREVEIFAPDEGREIGEKTLAHRQITRDRPRFDERRPLPILPHRFIIGEGGIHADRNRG